MLSSNEIIERMRVVNHCMKDSMEEKDPDASINKFIRELGSTLHCRLVCIYSLEEGGMFRCSYIWKADGTPLLGSLRVISQNALKREWIQDFRAGRTIVLDGADKLPDFHADFHREEHAEAKTSLVILIPVTLEKELYGFVVLNNPDRKYMPLDNQLYEIDANFIAIMLRHKHNVDYILESSTHDELTGVLSINAFWNYVTPLIEAIKEGREKRKMSIVFMDIRHFKIINGTMGHDGGNQLLIELGKTIRFFADTDAVGRSMADHFYLCIEDERAENVIKRIHNYMEKEAKINCDVKAGIYCLDGTEVSASLAAGRAKLANDRISENRYQYFRRYDTQMESELVMESYVTSHIDTALENGWIKVYFHPIINLLDGAISSFEALARWQDPVRGMLSPADFIGPLEESWLLYKLDLYMIEKVCQMLAEAGRRGRTLCPVSVNLSRHDLELPGLHEKINSIMDTYGLDHRLLEIEITESALIDNEEVIEEHIRRFHQDQYRIWLDDFGSGYSSFNAVQNFDFDVLKIDMQFLRNQNDKTPAILTDIVDMAKRTGMLALSEGVETKEQYDFLHDIGCVMAQGFYFTKPLPLTECLGVMEKKEYQMESREDRDFYEGIGRVNVLRPLISMTREYGTDTGSRTPTAINVVEDGKLISIYTNKAGRDWLKMAHFSDIESANNYTNARESANSQRIWECIDRLHDIGEYAYADYVTPGYTWKMQYRMIARDRKRQAYLTSSVNLGYSFSSVSGVDDAGSGLIRRHNIWAAIMESESMYFFWKDTDRRFLGANRAFKEIVQKEDADLFGKRFEEVVDSPDGDRLAEHERQVLKNGINQCAITGLPYAGGHEHRFLVNMAPLYKEGDIVGIVGYAMDITMVDRERKSLEQEILTDPLTGIPNRRGFDRIMDRLAGNEEVEQAYIINADINKFKSFNDRYGHAVGDVLLRAFAKEAVDFVGEDGAVSRNGGDEFQFFFSNPSPDLDRTLEAFFEREHEFRVGGIRYSYMISGGIAVYPDMGWDVQDLYDKADAALYHAKLDPHHRIAFFNELMKNESRAHMGLTFSDLASGEPASILIYRYDETEEILYANDNCIRLFGCDNMKDFMKLTGGSFRTLIHPDDVEITEKDIYLQQGNPDNDGYDFILYRIRTKSGEEKEVMDIGRRIHDAYYGDLFYVLLWDNKELLRMFRQPNDDSFHQLSGNDQNDYATGELSDFLSHLPGGMHRCYLSNPGHLEWCSPGLIHMLGYEEDEFHDLVGSVYVKVMAKEDWGSFVELGRRLSIKPGVGSCFYHLIRKDGTYIPCIEVMQSALGPDGIMYGYANVMDVTTIIRDVPLPDFGRSSGRKK